MNRLLARYDFEVEVPFAGVGDDLFGALRAKVSHGKARMLFSFAIHESDVASFTRWAIEKACGLATSIRIHRQWESAVWVEADAASLPGLKLLAGAIRAQFVGLWSALRKRASVEESDRRPFMQGLYDGMMDDARQPGQRLPGRSLPKRKRKAQRGTKVVGTLAGLSTHPYTLALDLGRQIRFKASVEQTVAALECALSLPSSEAQAA